MSQRTLRIVFAAICLLSMTQRPTAADLDQVDVMPFRYYVGKEVVLAEVVTTEKVKRVIEAVKDATDKKRCDRLHKPPEAQDLCVTTTPTTAREGQISTKVIPDATFSAPITLKTSALADTNTTVELTDGMLLKSINVKSTGRAGDIVSSIAKFAGVIVGGPELFATHNLFHTQRQKMGVESLVGGQWKSVTDTTPVTSCDPFAKPWSEQPDTVRLFMWETKSACDTFNLMDKMKEERDALVEKRLTLDAQLRSATLAEFDSIKKQLDQNAVDIKKLEDELKVQLTAFSARLDVFTATLELGTITTTTTYGQVLQLADLPLSKEFNDKMTEKAAGEAIKKLNKKPAQDLWDHARLVIAMDPEPLPKSADTIKVDPAKIATKPEGKDVTFYFRQGMPGRLHAFIADQPDAAKDPALRTIADRFDTFIFPTAPISQIAFSRSAWAKREFSLTFDAKGRPLKMEHASSSSAAAIAGALASSATAYRDELAATVSKVAEVQANQRKIALNDLTTQIERAKAEKDLLDAQLSLDVAGTNFEAVLRQKEAAAKLERLNAELALANTQEIAAQKAELEQIKLALDAVNQEIALIKAREELAKIKK